MAREYRRVKQYEEEILKMKEEGLTHREIGEKLGIERKKIKKFFERYRNNQRKIASGEAPKRPGRPRKDGNELPPSVQQLSKLSQLQYRLSSQERYIKKLEMENELMRDFLSHTERK